MKTSKHLIPEVYLALDKPRPGYSQHAAHWMRKRVGEGQCGGLLFVQDDGFFICNLREK